MYRSGMYNDDKGRTVSDRVSTSTTPGARIMPEQPDFNITARIPTDREQRLGEVPEWSDLVLEISDPAWDDGDGPHLAAVTVFLTRGAGELAIDCMYSALTDLLMTGEDASDETRGKAMGIARAISMIMNPYDPDIDSIREEAVERWEARQ